jgi:plastocyanin
MQQPVVRPRPRSLVAASLAIGASLVLGTGAAVAADHAVTIADFAFAPQTVTVTVGDTVTWTNDDAVIHTATATDGSWDTGDLAQGQSGAITFTAAGTFAYLCTPHPTMTGTVVVQAAAGGGGGGGGGGAAPTIPPTDASSLDGPDAAPSSGAAAVVAAALAVLVLTFVVPRRRSD